MTMEDYFSRGEFKGFHNGDDTMLVLSEAQAQVIKTLIPTVAYTEAPLAQPHAVGEEKLEYGVGFGLIVRDLLVSKSAFGYLSR
jgi:hypothetical protein